MNSFGPDDYLRLYGIWLRPSGISHNNKTRGFSKGGGASRTWTKLKDTTFTSNNPKNPTTSNGIIIDNI
jgi:hypothetical protein